jgi:hypothetical protein
MPTLTNTVEIIMRNTLAEASVVKNIYNVFHYRLLSGALDARLAILNGFIPAVATPLVTHLFTTDMTFVDVEIRLLDDATEQYFVLPQGTPGSIALPRLPGDVAIVYPLRCATRGKNFRGSKHITPVASAFVTKDELNATGVTAATFLVGGFGNNFTTSNGSVMGPVVVSRILSQLKVNPTSVIGSDVISVLLNKTIGTMRKRKEKTVR